ncbi:MAG: helix-turn-helix transcriptional regulator [Vallitaleaceae bacterium]|nr:helix-turn-helix transcriptional regulator [Vallitaleaceae bacterium]
MSKEKPNTTLQITESTYYVLLALKEPMHGYIIMQEVEKISEGALKIGPATLYTILSRLQKEGLIRAASHVAEEDFDPRRKPYTLTNKGKDVLTYEVKRRYKMAMHGIKKLGLRFTD